VFSGRWLLRLACAVKLAEAARGLVIVDNLSRAQATSISALVASPRSPTLQDRLRAGGKTGGQPIRFGPLDMSPEYEGLWSAAPGAARSGGAFAEQRAAPYSIEIQAPARLYTSEQQRHAPTTCSAPSSRSGLDVHIGHPRTMGGVATASHRGATIPRLPHRLRLPQPDGPGFPREILHPPIRQVLSHDKTLDPIAVLLTTKKRATFPCSPIILRGFVWGTNTTHLTAIPGWFNGFDYDGGLRHGAQPFPDAAATAIRHRPRHRWSEPRLHSTSAITASDCGAGRRQTRPNLAKRSRITHPD